MTLLAASLLPAQTPPENYHRLPHARGSFQGREIVFRVLGGQALVEGDMLLPIEPAKAPGRDAIVIAADRYRWPGGVIPYEIDPSLPNPERVTQAIAVWEASTPLRFKLRDSEANWVFVQGVASGCSANVGMIGGRQRVNLEMGCSVGNTVHEFGHAIGLFHTQSRIDRGLNLRVLYENIENDSWSQYDQQINSGIDIGPYDYGSIMHYSSAGFARANRPAMETVPPGIPLGQRSALSQADIQAVRILYGDTPRQVTIATHPPNLTVYVDGLPYTAPQSFDWAPGEQHSIAADPVALASSNSRLEFAKWSDGGAREHTITVRDGDSLYIANFARYFRLRTSVNLEGAGAVQVTPSSPDGFYPEGAVLRLAATPAAGFRFFGWVAGDGGVTYLSANEQGAAANPTELTLRAENAHYRASFTTSPFTTIGASLPGAIVSVDGVRYYAPRNFLFPPGSQHAISVAEEQTYRSALSRALFRSWSDGGAREHTVTAAAGPSTLIATLQLQHAIDKSVTFVRAATAVAPTTANVRFSPDAPDGYYDAGSIIELLADSPPGTPFLNWYGAAGSGSSPLLFQVTGNGAVGAAFASPPAFTASSVVNDASRQPVPLSPGGLYSIHSATQGAAVQLQNADVPVLERTENRVVFQAPDDIGRLTTAAVAIATPTQTYSRTIPVQPAAPGVYTTTGAGSGQAHAVNHDGGANSPALPAPPGSTLTIRVTGIGRVIGGVPVLPLRAEIGGLDAPIESIAPSTLPGQYSLRIRIPEDVETGNQVPLFVLAAGMSSQPGVTVALSPTPLQQSPQPLRRRFSRRR